MGKKAKPQKSAPPPPPIPKWIEGKSEYTQKEIVAATNSRLAFRALRRASGLTQPELAQKLGVSLAVVQGAESGFRPVSRELARAVQTKLGVFASGVTGFTSEPVTLRGEKVTPDSISRATAEEPHTLSRQELDHFTMPLIRLVEAAAKAGRLRVFGATYRDILFELRKALDLDDALASVLSRESLPVAKGQITRQQLRESPDVAKALELVGIVDDPSRPDEEIIETTNRVRQKPVPWIQKSPWLPNWRDFVDENGTIRWATPTAESSLHE